MLEHYRSAPFSAWYLAETHVQVQCDDPVGT